MFLPFANPDLFWHLSAARRIVETGSIPRADWLSYTRAGASWVDFEWLTQLIWLGMLELGGWWGLMVLKVALFAGAAGALWRSLVLYRLSVEARSAWLLAWALALLPANDLRPEGFSLVLFSVLWLLLDRERLAPGRPSARLPRPAEAAASAIFFMLWANLHAGFAYGLVLLALAALAAPPQRRVRLAAFAVAGTFGTLLNPAGWRLYPVLLEHARDIENLARLIREWQPPTPHDPWLWPFWALLVASAGVALERQWKGRLPGLHSLALCVFGLSACRHIRTAPYFVVVAVPVAAAAFSEIDWKRRVPAGRLAALALLVYCVVRVVPELRAVPFVPRFAPEAAAAFLESEAAVLAGRRMYHPIEWGGFLAWRLGPRFPVFADGRYLFHDLVKASDEARRDPDSLRAVLQAHAIDLVLLKRSSDQVQVSAGLKNGRAMALSRPAWLFFVPRTVWALVYWDERALVLVRRSAVPAAWLRDREYTLYRPGDEAGAALRISEGDADAAVLAAERSRHGTL